MSIPARRLFADAVHDRGDMQSAPWRQLLAFMLAAALLAGCGSGASRSAASSSAGSTPDSTAGAGALGSPTPNGSPGGSSSGSPSADSAGSAGSGGSGSSAAPAGGDVGSELQQQFVSVVAKVGPSVVVIETASGLGSGVVFDDHGDIVTNAHVVGTDRRFRVTTASGERLDATLVGAFTPNDLAVVRVTGDHLSPATFGTSAKLVVGDVVLAIGNPLGLQSSVTEGIVSATGRTVAEPGGAALPNVIQTSAPINPGNSGGALANLAGEVIGIPTLTATDPQIGGSAPGIGFAIPSDTAKDIATQLIDHGKVVSSHRAYLGIRAADVQGGQGVLVYSVDPGGPAAKAGLPADVLITSIAGQPTPDSSALATVLAGLQPGQAVPVEILRRDGSTATVQVTLGELPG
jgi:putative serine protease PepD